jgi:NADH-quinone oxidoreductase subunit F
MAQITGRIVKGKGKIEDLDLLVSLANGMFGRTICPLADAAVGPVTSFIGKFRQEFEDYIRNQKGPKEKPYPVKWLS